MSELIEMENKEISAAQENYVQMSQPDRLLEMAISKGADMAQLEKLLDLQERYNKEEARKAFSIDFSEFKKNPPKIIKDMINTQYGSAYSSIGAIVGGAVPELAKAGFSTRWDYLESDGPIKVKCIITHSMGHSESVTISGLPDKSGSKNPLQEMKSTRTYLKIETFEAVTGLVSSINNLNDDGAGSGKQVELITEKQETELHARITDNELDMDVFLKWAKVDKISDIKADNFKKMQAGITKSIKAKNDNT